MPVYTLYIGKYNIREVFAKNYKKEAGVEGMKLRRDEKGNRLLYGLDKDLLDIRFELFEVLQKHNLTIREAVNILEITSKEIMISMKDERL